MTNKIIEVREKQLEHYTLRIEWYSNGVRRLVKKHEANGYLFLDVAFTPQDMDCIYQCEKEYRDTTCPYHPGATPPCSEDDCKCYGRAMNMEQALQSIEDGRM